MGPQLSSLIPQLLVCFIGLFICIATQLPVRAADGEIVLTRDVQPRSATRQELVPDPNPQTANPNHSAQVRSAVQGARLPGELSDADFAGVSSGSSLANGVHLFDQPVLQADRQAPGRAGLGVSGSAGAGSVGRATGNVGRVGGEINRSVNQGLRPLQGLGK